MGRDTPLTVCGACGWRLPGRRQSEASIHACPCLLSGGGRD